MTWPSSWPGREPRCTRSTSSATPGRCATRATSATLLDETARAAYRRRIGELDQAIADAEDLGHADAADRARTEREAIVAELTRAYGLGGRPRRVGDPAERARTSVTWRIRDAIGRVERVHPELGAHLRNAVRTGTYCRYDPEVPPGWVM